MTQLKSVLDIEVNDRDFEAFKQSFGEYNNDLRGQSAAWKKVGDALAQISRQIATISDAMGGVADSTDDAARGQDRLRRNTESTGRAMTSLARSTRAVASGIWDATKMLAKWAGIAGSIGGLLAVGGIFGINRMAQGIATGQRASTGYGGSGDPAALKAFGINVGSRITGAEGILDAVNAAQRSYGGQVPFIAAGMQPGQYSGDTVSATMQYLAAVRQMFAGVDPKNLRSEMLQAYRVSDILDLKQAQQLIGMSGAQFAELQKSTAADTGRFGMAGAGEAYRSLGVQFDRAGIEIANAFAISLKPLVPNLQKLSQAIVDVTKSFLGSGSIKSAIDDLSQGIRRFSEYLTSPEFGADMADALDAISAFARGMKKIGKAMFGDSDAEYQQNWIKAESRFGLRKGTFGAMMKDLRRLPYGEQSAMVDELYEARNRIASEVSRAMRTGNYQGVESSIYRAMNVTEPTARQQQMVQGMVSNIVVTNAAGSGLSIIANGSAVPAQ